MVGHLRWSGSAWASLQPRQGPSFDVVLDDDSHLLPAVAVDAMLRVDREEQVHRGAAPSPASGRQSRNVGGVTANMVAEASWRPP